MAAAMAFAGEKDAIANAVAHGDRTEKDRERDATSKPAEVLKFLGVKPGQNIADLFAGGGYYSELLSHVVGKDGVVYAHNNEAYRKFLKDAIPKRFEGRLANVKRLDTEPDNLGLPEGKLDLALMVMSYHDVYWVNDGWPKIDPAQFLGQVNKALKPGGALAIIDHAAAPGTGTKSVQELHRIDKKVVIADLQDAGFKLAKESDLLVNPKDDKSILVFDPSIRGKTDRFILLFRKPK